jgi:hypothetical protein
MKNKHKHKHKNKKIKNIEKYLKISKKKFKKLNKN